MVNGHYQVDEFHVLKFVKARSEINGFMSRFGLCEEYTMYNIQGLSIVVSVSAEMKLIRRVVVL
jgi:hypothetical protein